jgi:transcriptional regulator of NAD metabolism
VVPPELASRSESRPSAQASSPAALLETGAEVIAGRRAAILERLAASERPVPGEVLARELGVSRQAIVHDVAVLRAAGRPIVATVRGYLLLRPPAADVVRGVVAVRHGPAEAEAELTALVDLGVRVVDVVVEHPVYGELRAELHIGSRADVAAWAEATRRSGAHLLSELTDGVHLHTIEAASEDRLAAARSVLRAGGFLLPDS